MKIRADIERRAKGAATAAKMDPEIIAAFLLRCCRERKTSPAGLDPIRASAGKVETRHGDRLEVFRPSAPPRALPQTGYTWTGRD